MRLGREALALARETGDPDALSTVLTRAWALIDGSEPFWPELRSLYEEAERVAREAGDPADLAGALHFSGFAGACRGERALADDKIAESIRLHDSLRRPYYDWTACLQRQALAEHRGDLATAEQAVFEAIEHGQRADVSPNVLRSTLGGCLYQIRRAQGRLDEMVDLLVEASEAAPDIPLFRIVVAGAYVETDRIEEGRPHYMWLAENECANVPPDTEYPVTMCGLARLSYDVRPPVAVAEYVYERLAPFAGTFNWSGQQVTDANDLGLAMLAAMLGRPDDSDRHFADAIDLGERAGAQAFLARCHYNWARVLADRGETEKARVQTELAVHLAEELDLSGPFGIVVRGRALLESL
jgi:tetratricopeptide (TPR) repeat protein